MYFIPLIFARPFESIHLSLGNIVHTFLYATSLLRFHIVKLNKEAVFLPLVRV